RAARAARGRAGARLAGALLHDHSWWGCGRATGAPMATAAGPGPRSEPREKDRTNAVTDSSEAAPLAAPPRGGPDHGRVRNRPRSGHHRRRRRLHRPVRWHPGRGQQRHEPAAVANAPRRGAYGSFGTVGVVSDGVVTTGVVTAGTVTAGVVT